MGYKTTLTRISSAKSTKSRQTTSYQYPSGNGVVLAGSTINSQTTAYLDITVPGQARAFTAVSGGAGTTTIISNLQYLDTNNIVTNAIAVSTTGGNILINGNGFANTSRVYVNNQLVTNTFVNSNAIIATLSANSVGNVSLAVFNSSGQSGVFSNSNVRFSGAPSWVSSGAISSYNDIASNVALEASGDGTLTYSLQSGSGSLPSGISLVSTGYLSGTATGYTTDTVVTFTLVVTDAEGQAAQQNYSYTVFIGDTYFKQTSLLLSADTANTFISDSSTNNFLITRVGDTRPNRMSPYWPGGWSAYFDGTGDYLSIANNSAFQFGTGDFTIECWINKSAAANGAIIDVRSGGTGAIPYAFYVDANNFPYFYDGSSYTSSVTIVNNAWNHIAVTRSAGTLKIFVNGVQGYTASYSTSLNATGSLLIGGTAAYTTGYISNLRLIKGTALYTANFTPSTTALTTVANTSLLTLRDSVLADNSPNNFTITRNGDTRLTTFSPFNTAPYTFTANSNSVYFDGTGDYLNVSGGSSFILDGVNFTIEAWVYVEPGQNSQALCNFAPHNTLAISLNRTGVSDTYIYIGNGSTWTGSPAIASSSNFRPNSWNHVSLVRNGSTITLYHNGVAAGTTSTMPSGMNGGLYIGSMWTGVASEFLKGYISNFRILKGTALYTANFTPSTTALTSVANTSLLTCQSTTVVDNSSNNFAITVNGNPNVSIVNPFGDNVSAISNYTWSANSYSASGYFDGTGDYLNAGSNSAFAFGTGAYTIECWIYPTTTTTQVYTGIRATGGLQLYYDPTAGFGVSSVGSPGFLFAGTLAINQWYHIAVCRTSTSSNSTFIFINGILRATGTDSTNWTVNGPLIIGANQSGTEAFTGYISNVRWIKGSAAYNRSFIPPTAPLTTVANTSILTLQTDIGSNSSQFVDQSAQNNLITRNGNASQGTYSPLVPSSWSAYFDGTGDYLSVDSPGATLTTGPFTVEGWIYLTSGGAIRNIIENASWNFGNGSGYRIFISSADKVELSANPGTYNVFPTILTSNSTVTTNTWNHIAIVRNTSNVITCYINGLSSNSVSYSSSLNLSYAGATPSTRIGAMILDSTLYHPWIGYLSSIRVVNGSAIYAANFTPSTTALTTVANTSLLTLREPILADNSGNNFTITRNGDTKIVPFGPFSPQTVTPDSYSYRFSNASDYISTTNSNLALGTNDWTVESWVYPRFTANSGIFQISNVQYGLTNSNLNTVALGFSSGNKAIVRVANATYTSTGTTITANAWTHLALVKSSNVSKLYINGTLDSTIGTSGSITDTVNYTGTTNIAVGGYGSTSALANAYISNFRVVSNSAVYISNFTVNTGPISAISGTTLLTCQANTIVDGSLANLTITANANVTPSKFNPFDETVTVGQSYSGTSAGGSAYFDGTGDFLAMASSPQWALPGSYTIEFWLYPTSIPAFGGVFSTRNSVSSAYGISFSLISSDSKLWLEIANTNTTNLVLKSINTIVINQWQHIAISYNGTTLRLYLNGELQASGSVTQAPTLTDLYIGRYYTDVNNYYYLGYISNFRWLKGTALYTSNFVPPAAPALPTTANTSLLLNFTNSGVVDSTGRNVLETVNDARVTTSIFKYGISSLYFDGTGDYMYVMGTSSEMAFGSGDFTVEFWVYPAAANQTATIIDWRGANVNGAYPMLYLSSGSIKLYVNTADQISGGAVTASVWSHIALSRSSGVTKLFLNGTQTGSNYTDTNAYLVSASRPIIGSNGFDLLIPFNGYLDDIRITKGYARYTANFTAPTAPFVTK
jgi:hypothetical protein